MAMAKATRLGLLVLWVAGGTGCSLSIDQILEMKEGSRLDLAITSEDRSVELPQGSLEFEGGTVMRIDVSMSLFDYLDGTVDGDVAVLDLLFAVPDLRFLVIHTGLICVVLDETTENGGTFAYDLVREEATFDVFVGTRALPVVGNFGKLLRGGAFQFPFDLESTVPLSAVDALGLFTGTGSIEVTQEIDEYFSVAIVYIKDDPSQDTIIPLHVTGSVTLGSTDAFPVTPLVGDCVDALEAGSV